METKYGKIAWERASKKKKTVPTPFTELYTWWWQTGVEYKKAGEMARRDWCAKKGK